MKMKITGDKRPLMLTAMMLAGLALAGCSQDNEPATGTKATEPGAPLSLDVAEVVERTTRSGSAGSIDYSVLSKSGYGFGVVASELGWTNQQVKYVDDAGTTAPGSAFFYPSKWRYTGDVLYWLKDIHEKTGSRIEKVNFYAYAPYVTTASLTPTPSNGITAISGHTIDYAINGDITQGVDLLWGVRGETGLPWENTTYTDKTGSNQPTGGPVLFTFRHALSAIGFRVQSMIGQKNDLDNLDDQSAIAGVLRSGGNYKVTIKKIELEGDFHPRGTLDLDNTAKNEPKWTPAAATSKTLTVSADPNEDNNNNDSQIVDTLKHLHAKTETSAGDATTIMDQSSHGVSQEPQQQVVANDASGREPFFLVIPSATRNYTLTLHWCVSAMLPDKTTYVSEDHVSPITIENLELKAGTKYIMTFVIGLKLIGLTVTATDWQETTENTEVIIEQGTSASESLAREMQIK